MNAEISTVTEDLCHTNLFSFLPNMCRKESLFELFEKYAQSGTDDKPQNLELISCRYKAFADRMEFKTAKQNLLSILKKEGNQVLFVKNEKIIGEFLSRTENTITKLLEKSWNLDDFILSEDIIFTLCQIFSPKLERTMRVIQKQILEVFPEIEYLFTNRNDTNEFPDLNNYFLRTLYNEVTDLNVTVFGTYYSSNSQQIADFANKYEIVYDPCFTFLMLLLKYGYEKRNDQRSFHISKPFADLPEELVVRLYNMLPDNAYQSLSSTCHFFKRVSRNPNTFPPLLEIRPKQKVTVCLIRGDHNIDVDGRVIPALDMPVAVEKSLILPPTKLTLQKACIAIAAIAVLAFAIHQKIN